MEAVSDCLQSQVFLARPKDITHYLLWSPSRFLKRPFCPKSWATIPFPTGLQRSPVADNHIWGTYLRYARFDETSPSPTRMNSVKNHLCLRSCIFPMFGVLVLSSSLFVVVGEYMYVPWEWRRHVVKHHQTVGILVLFVTVLYRLAWAWAWPRPQFYRFTYSPKLTGLFFFTHTLSLHTLFGTVVTHATNGFIPHVWPCFPCMDPKQQTNLYKTKQRIL